MDLIKIILKFVLGLDFLLLLYLIAVVVYIITAIFPNITLNIIRKGAATVILIIGLVKGLTWSEKIALASEYSTLPPFPIKFLFHMSEEGRFCFKWGFIYALFVVVGLAVFFNEIVSWKYIKKK